MTFEVENSAWQWWGSFSPLFVLINLYYYFYCFFFGIILHTNWINYSVLIMDDSEYWTTFNGRFPPYTNRNRPLRCHHHRRESMRGTVMVTDHHVPRALFPRANSSLTWKWWERIHRAIFMFKFWRGAYLLAELSWHLLSFFLFSFRD